MQLPTSLYLLQEQNAVMNIDDEGFTPNWNWHSYGAGNDLVEASYAGSASARQLCRSSTRLSVVFAPSECQ